MLRRGEWPRRPSRIAGGTDALVDHGDACLALAIVLDTAGNAAGARAAAEQALGLYEQKGAAALAEKARDIIGLATAPVAPAPPESPPVEMDNECMASRQTGDGCNQSRGLG